MGGVKKRYLNLRKFASVAGKKNKGKIYGTLVDDHPFNMYEGDLDERALRAALRAKGKQCVSVWTALQQVVHLTFLDSQKEEEDQGECWREVAQAAEGPEAAHGQKAGEQGSTECAYHAFRQNVD